jgi:hypothetical protein
MDRHTLIFLGVSAVALALSLWYFYTFEEWNILWLTPSFWLIVSRECRAYRADLVRWYDNDVRHALDRDLRERGLMVSGFVHEYFRDRLVMRQVIQNYKPVVARSELDTEFA